MFLLFFKIFKVYFNAFFFCEKSNFWAHKHYSGYVDHVGGIWENIYPWPGVVHRSSA